MDIAEMEAVDDDNAEVHAAPVVHGCPVVQGEAVSVSEVSGMVIGWAWTGVN